MRVAGVRLDLDDVDFHLMACRTCGFQFKSPGIPQEKLIACYEAANNDHWGLDVNPIERNFDRMASAIARHARGNRVLDIGCFNGAFLNYLGDQWERFGLEPSVQAAKVARQRHVDVLGDTIEAIGKNVTFDVITAFDVIEHVIDPKSFFSQVRQHLRPGGIFVASSGDTETIGWRLQKSRYWYCSCLPEHVSFFNETCLDFVASEYQMQSISHEHMSHKRTPLSDRILQGFNGYSYAVLMRTNWLGLPFFRRKFEQRAGTAWGANKDHFLHVMKAI